MRLNHVIILLVILLLISSCQRRMDKQSAQKHLKAFDSELIQLTRNISRTTGYHALEALVKIGNLPLPLGYSGDDNPLAYNLEENKGVYAVNQFHKLEKVQNSDSLIIIYPFISEKDSVAKLVMSQYNEEMTILGVMFPTEAKISIEIAGSSMLHISSHGEIAHGVPVKSNTEFRFGNYVMNANLITKLTRKKGKVDFSLNISKLDKDIFTAKAKFNAYMGENTSLSVSELKCSGQVFPVSFKVASNYGDIAKNSTDFVHDFNQCTKINLWNYQGTQKIGGVQLGRREKSDRLNFMVIYNDGSSEFLSDYLFSLETLLNVKL